VADAENLDSHTGAHVVRVLNYDELIISAGQSSRVRQGMIFAVLDPLTQNVRDPLTGEDLGSLDREKARVVVARVAPRMSLVHVCGRPPLVSTKESQVADEAAGLVDDAWPGGIEEGDPVLLVVHRSRSSRKRLDADLTEEVGELHSP
jgi:hypothetical protein